jgi:hypothetical protein
VPAAGSGDPRRRQVGNGYSIPGLASAFSTVIRATRADAKSDVGKGKAPPSRRFKSVRCRSQERLRSCPSMSRLDRIETTILHVPPQKGGIEVPPDMRSVRLDPANAWQSSTATIGMLLSIALYVRNWRS